MSVKGTGKFQVLPALSDEDRHHLRESLRQHGVRVPVEVDEDGELLDGHYRDEICQELGIECPRVVVAGLGDDQAKREYARGINLARRHLSPDQKRLLISEQLADTPDRSNRQVAKALGVSHHTVGDVRKDLQSTGQIAQLEKTVGRDGKSRRAPIGPVVSTGPKQTDVMLTELHHLAGHTRDISPGQFVAAIKSDSRRRDAFRSAKDVRNWIEEVLLLELVRGTTG